MLISRGIGHGTATPDTVSITSSTSDDTSISEQLRISGVNDDDNVPVASEQDVGLGSKDMGNSQSDLHIPSGERVEDLKKEADGSKISELDDGEVNKCDSEKTNDSVGDVVESSSQHRHHHHHHKKKRGQSGDRYEEMEKRLHEFEKSLPEEILPVDLSKSLKTESKSEDIVKAQSSTISESADKSSVVIEEKASPKNVEASALKTVRQDSVETSIYSVYKRSNSTNNDPESVSKDSVSSPDLTSPTSPSSVSSADDFYKKYSSSTYSLSSLAGTTEHPLTPNNDDNEDDVPEQEKLESFQVSGPSEEIPSYKLVNNWMEIMTQGNVTSLAMSHNHVWYTDKSNSLQYSSLLGSGIQWHKAVGNCRQIAVSNSGSIIWRLDNSKAYAGSKITAKQPWGTRWLDAVREAKYIAVDDNCAW